MDEGQEAQLVHGDHNNRPMEALEEINNGRLYIKLRISKTDEEESAGLLPVKELLPARVCKICYKSYSSGKALGGHMRMHVLANKKIQKPEFKKHHRASASAGTSDLSGLGKSNAGVSMMDGKPTCCLCGKNFLSMKSLYGHMRSHPERPWKGIRPPPTAINNTCSSTTLSDAAPQKVDDRHIDSAVVDLSRSLSGWSATAKRGRKTMASAASGSGSGFGVEERMQEAVFDLMMLAHGNPKQRSEDCEATNSNSLTNKTETENSPSRKLKINERGSTQKKIDRGKGKTFLGTGFAPEKPMNLEWENELDSSHNSTDCSLLDYDYEFRRMMKKKKRRKMKLVDLEAVGDGIFQKQKQIPQTPNRYICSICNKSFSTHQALGGHKSSHNKLKNIHTSDESASAANVSAAEAKGVSSPEEGSQNGGRILGFDLNEVPNMKDEEEEEEDVVVEYAFFMPEHEHEHAAAEYASSSYNSVN